MEINSILGEQLLALLESHNAHMDFDAAVADFPPESFNEFPANIPYTPWHLLEHLRRTQFDILDFIRNPNYVSQKWPDDYWPAKTEIADKSQWAETIRQFRSDLSELKEIVKDPKIDFLGPIPHAPTYTIFREILVVADHNAYHVGEFAILRQVMGTWGEHHSG